MPAPTQSDWINFQNENYHNKVEILYTYLCTDKSNMNDVVDWVYGRNSGVDARRVSGITRCYGLEGRNGGRFKSWGLTKGDIEAFVKKYPKGCSYDMGKTITEFMQKRVQDRQAQIKQAQSSQVYQPRQQLRSKPANTSVTYSYGQGYEEQQVAGGERSGMELVYVISVFCVALLIRWFFSGTLWTVWYRKILTIVAVLFALGGVSSVILDLSKPYNESKKGLVILLGIVAIGLAIYSVCNYPGHWIPRIITAIISMVLSVSVTTILEE